MKKGMAFLLATVLCAAGLTACGSEPASSNGGASTTQEATLEAQEGTASQTESTGTGSDDAAPATLEEGRLIVGTNAAFPPFEYLGDDGTPDGFDVALIKAIGEKLGLEVEVQDMEFNSLVASVGNKIDAAIAGMTVTEERLVEVDFSDPYYEAVQYVIVPAGVEAASEDDLTGKTIGVQLGTTGDFIATDLEDAGNATVQRYDKAVDAVNDMLNGRVDLVIIDKNPAQVFESNFAGQVTAIDGAQFNFDIENYAIALPKGSALVEQINQALEELKADGTFDALVAQYIEGVE